MIDKAKLRDELTDAFIWYQHRLDNPMPSAAETKETVVDRYRNDPIFHARVKNLVCGVMGILDNHVDWQG